ncbi:MAG: hypothetical protein KJS92_01365 [Bacteroidetes bacterium]|nr:hypothetical protein [Bacteroidota bacterium]
MSPIGRIALRIGIPVLLLAIIVAIYLRYNFNSRSKIVLLVPPDAQWVFHLQTRLLQKEVTPGQLPALNAFSDSIRNMPLFSKVKDPRQIGIDLYSDLLLFRTPQGFVLALQLLDEQKFRNFLTQSIPPGLISGIIDRINYSYVHGLHKPMYLAFRNKALMGFLPFSADSSNPMGFRIAEQALDSLFSGRTYNWMTRKDVQQLYEPEPHMVYWKSPDYSGKMPSMQVRLDQELATLNYPGTATKQLSPLLLFHHASPAAFAKKDALSLLNKDNSINSNTFLNLVFELFNEHLTLLKQ